MWVRPCSSTRRDAKSSSTLHWGSWIGVSLGAIPTERGVRSTSPFGVEYCTTDGCMCVGGCKLACPCTRSMRASSLFVRKAVLTRRPSRVTIVLCRGRGVTAAASRMPLALMPVGRMPPPLASP